MSDTLTIYATTLHNKDVESPGSQQSKRGCMKSVMADQGGSFTFWGYT